MEPNKWKGNRREVAEDFFETPNEAIIPIRKYIPSNVKTIWEPTHGKGAISSKLEEWGYKVVKTDKFPKTTDCIYADFLDCEVPDCDMIIFNPPFGLKTEFLDRAVKTGLPFMFICPLSILETAKRIKLFRENHLSVLNLNNRTNYIGKKSAADGIKKVFFHSIWIMNHSDYKDKILYVD